MVKSFSKGITLLILCALILFGCAMPKDRTSKNQTVRAAVVDIEKYGHAVLDISTADFTAAGYTLGDIVQVHWDSYESAMPFFDGYYSNPGETMLRGFSPEENIAVCINYGNFSQETGIAVGDIVEITLAEKAGMRALQELCSLHYSNDRADYSSNAAFANFRAVTAGRIGNHKLYRGTSPIDNEKGRASYANNLIVTANIATVLNLADSDEDIEAFCAGADFDTAYYRTLYETGNVIALDLSGDFYSEKFAASIASGFTRLAQKEAPYFLHCLEGKDRTGFAVVLLQALMGAQLDEIVDDYMLSFYNYYGIDKEKEPLRYQTVLDNNLTSILCHVTGAATADMLESVDLEAAVTAYLLRAGMEEADINTLKEKLSE